MPIKLAPDLGGRIRNQASEIFNVAGQPIVWRKYQSFQPGKPEFGIDNKYTYTEINTVALIQTRVLRETDERGGSYVQGSLGIKMQEAITHRDEIVWMGTVYRIDSEPTPVSLGSTIIFWECEVSRVQDLIPPE